MSTRYKDVSMLLRATPPISSPYLGTLFYNTPSSLHPNVAYLKWNERLKNRIQKWLLCYHTTWSTAKMNLDQFRNQNNHDQWFSILCRTQMDTLQFDLIQIQVTVAKVSILCNLMSSGNVKNQLLKHTWKFWFIGISFNNCITDSSALHFSAPMLCFHPYIKKP